MTSLSENLNLNFVSGDPLTTFDLLINVLMLNFLV